MALPHPQSRNYYYRNENKPNNGGVLWNLFKRAVNITEYRNAENDVNPTKNHAYEALSHGHSNPPTTRSMLPMNFVQPYVAPL